MCRVVSDKLDTGPRASAPNGDAAGPAPEAMFIGRYQVISRLGAGGMGEVYLARATGVGGFEKEVVIKRILPHLASDPGFVQRFIEEGKLVVRLRHAGIAQVLDMGEDQGVFYIAMEHVDGKDLGELMRIAAAAGQKMPVPLVAHLLVALLDALDHAHRATDAEGRPLGIIHRDVSPSNIMIATTGEVKLLDFGIARATERLQASTTGAIRGKYSYMSPQQASGLELDARSDLFSVGVLGWELLTGVRPFDGASDLLTLDRIRFHDPGRVRDLVPEVPEDLATVIERCLAKTPEQRFGSAHEASEALRAHIVRSGKIVTARELAAWMSELVQSLPRGLRDRSMQGLSIDELLRLGLGSEPGQPRALTPSGTPAPRSQTVLAVAAPADTAAVPSPTTAAERRRARFPVLLIALNLALIAVVLLLVLRPSGPSTDDPRPEPGSPDAARVASVDVPLAATEVVAETGTARADGAAVVSATDAGPEATPPAGPPESTPPIAPGAFAGEVLATLDQVFAEDVELVVRTHPPGAQVAIAGLGVARAPRTVKARPGTALSGRVSAPEHEARAFEVVVGEDEAVTVTLKPLPRGKVQFKFFPAEGTRVVIDGRPLTVGSNVVATELPVGNHTLVLETRDGKRLVRSFEITEEQTTNLGTLDAARGS